MHIYFSGIGGTGIGPLALIAHQAGFTVSGSDKQESQYITYLQKQGISLHIGQTEEAIAKVHKEQPIDWFVYTSALTLEQPHHPELMFAQKHNIRSTKRDECLNEILKQTDLKMIAVAGTHGKTTTTAMIVWLYYSLSLPLSYSVGAKLSFSPMGKYDKESTYFAYECDEFDKNFLHFNPAISVIPSVDWDHHEIYPTRDDYKQSFVQFINQSEITYLYQKDALYLDVTKDITILNDNDQRLQQITLLGLHNRKNALLAIEAVHAATGQTYDLLIKAINNYPGSSRRFEKLANNLYSDYAHTPEEIAATLQLAKELSDSIVVVYEPLTDRRQHYMKDQYRDLFTTTKQVYWLPSYLAREDQNLPILSPNELISGLNTDTNAVSAIKDDMLAANIAKHIQEGSIVLCLAGGGGGSLDEWARQIAVNLSQ